MRSHMDLQVAVSNRTTIYCDNLNNIQRAKNPSFMPGPSTLRYTIISSTSESFLVKSNWCMFRRTGVKIRTLDTPML